MANVVWVLILDGRPKFDAETWVRIDGEVGRSQSDSGPQVQKCDRCHRGLLAEPVVMMP